MKLNLLTRIFLILVLFPLTTLADELYEYPRPLSALGMGGVYLPFVQNVDAVQWNPAALANVEKFDWQLFDLEVGANGLDVYNTYQTMQKSGCSGTACYEQFYGTPVHFESIGKSSFAMPRLGFMVYESILLNATMHNPAFPNLNVNYLADNGFLLGYGFPLAAGWDAGFTLKRIVRTGGDENLSLSTITTAGASVLSNFNQNGTGYGVDLGLQYKLVDTGPLKTTMGIQWQDVGDTSFAAPAGITAPPMILNNLSLGIGSEFDFLIGGAKAGFEYRHITDTGEQIGKKLHLGMELDLPLIDVQAGLNEGYPTFGMGLDFFLFRIDAASYTEETGVYPGQLPSQRFKIALSMEFSVDADFNITSADGKKRKLKQRR